jgi:hypothetical protein
MNEYVDNRTKQEKDDISKIMEHFKNFYEGHEKTGIVSEKLLLPYFHRVGWIRRLQKRR